MATFENVGLALQLVANIHGLVRDMRDNANGYKAQVTAGRDIAGIAAVMVADANAYLTRIKWVTDAVTANQAGVNTALQALGLTLTEANQLKTLFNNTANHTAAAALTTGAQINTEADYILANIPNWQRLY
jgi:hypothetical protein